MRTQLALLGAAATLSLSSLAGVLANPGPVNAAMEREQLTIEIEAGDYYFSPSDIVVAVGQPVEFVATNVGEDRHRVNFQMEGSDDRVRSDDAGPGGVITLETTFTVPGVYQMWCSAATDGVSHRDMGMVGTLTVE